VAHLRLSKQTLSRRREELALYRRVLPSLDLKRRQLTVEHERARRAASAAHAEVERFEAAAAAAVPMLADLHVHVEGLLSVREVVLAQEHLLGVRLPVVERIELRCVPYARLAKPAWVDLALEQLAQALERRVHADVAARRAASLHRAMRRVTQRVNLFERVLIPRAQDDIRRIRVHLDDLEREAVVRAKIAKARRRDGASAAGGTP
jgi:V/A-type H+-transporting ATPase subunit D